MNKNENQYIQWDTNALIQLSEILESDIQDVVIANLYEYDGMVLHPVSCKNTLRGIVEGVQSYYNQLKLQDRRDLIYIEGVQYKIELKGQENSYINAMFSSFRKRLYKFKSETR